MTPTTASPTTQSAGVEPIKAERWKNMMITARGCFHGVLIHASPEAAKAANDYSRSFSDHWMQQGIDGWIPSMEGDYVLRHSEVMSTVQIPWFGS